MAGYQRAIPVGNNCPAELRYAIDTHRVYPVIAEYLINPEKTGNAATGQGDCQKNKCGACELADFDTFKHNFPGMLFANIVNSTGVFLILTAFFLLILGKIKAVNPWYLWMNLIGAGMSCFGSWLIQAYPFVVLEGTWAVVAAVGLVRRTRKPV
jgi:hypothetical protein